MSRVPVGAAPACDGEPISPADFGVERFSVAAVLDRRAEQFPDRVMMSIDGADVTFEQMRQRSCAAANALLDLGIGPGDCVALFAGDLPGVDLLLVGCRTHRRGGRRRQRGQQGRLPAARASTVAGEGDRHRRRAPAAGCRVGRSAARTWRSSSCSNDLLADERLAAVGRTRRRRRRHRVILLHVRHDRAIESRCHHLALPVHHGCDRRVGVGVRPG